MNLNVFRPYAATKAAMEKPNLAAAFLLVLASGIVSFAIVLSFNPAAELAALAASAIAKQFAYFIALGIVLYAVGFALKGRELKGKFAAVLSTLSLLWAVDIVISVITFAGVRLAVSQRLFDAIASSAGSFALVETLNSAEEMLAAEPALVNETMLYVVFAVVLLLFLFRLFFTYKVCKATVNAGFGKNLAAFVVLLIASWLLNTFV